MRQRLGFYFGHGPGNFTKGRSEGVPVTVQLLDEASITNSDAGMDGRIL